MNEEKKKEKRTVGNIVMNVILILLTVTMLVVSGNYVYKYIKEYNLFAKKPNTSSEEVQKVLTEEDVKKLVKDKYEIANNTYLFKGIFTVGKDLYITDDKQSYLVTNYNKVLEENYTTKGKIEFEEYNKEIIIKNEDKVYKVDTKKEKNAKYDSTEFVKKSIEDKKIVFIAKSKYLDGDKIEYKEEEFILVKQNNNWLIDSFKIAY